MFQESLTKKQNKRGGKKGKKMENVRITQEEKKKKKMKCLYHRGIVCPPCMSGYNFMRDKSLTSRVEAFTNEQEKGVTSR